MKMLHFPKYTAIGMAALLSLSACASNSATPAASPSYEGGVNTSAELYESLPQAIKDKGEIVFAGDSHPPYRTVEANGTTVSGIDAEVQAALSEVMGVPMRIEITEGLPQMLSGMKAGRYDAFNGPVKATPERLKEFDGVSWLSSRTAYLIPTNGGSSAQGSEDLCGTTAAGVKGSITEENSTKLSDWCISKGKEAVTFLGLADTNATILAVKAKRADSAATTEAGAIDLLAQEKDQWRYVTQTEEQGAGVDQLVLLTPKDNGLGTVFHKAFEQIFDNGRYKKITEKWGLTEVAIDGPVLNPGS